MMLGVPAWESLVPLVAWTLLHFVWQGLLVWAVASCALEAFGRRGADVRYAILTGAVGVMVACPIVTGFVLVARKPQFEKASVMVAFDRQPLGLNVGGTSSGRGAFARQESATPPELIAAWVGRSQHWIATAWLCGAVLFVLRAAGSSVGVWLLVRRSEPPADEMLLRFERVARSVGLRVLPKFGLIEGLGQAMAVGVFKPMVLLPTSWLCELPPDVLEAVVAHELAHVRRHDVAINFL